MQRLPPRPLRFGSIFWNPLGRISPKGEEALMDWQDKKKPDTDKLSIYDLPALNAVINQYEPSNAKGADPQNGKQHPPSAKG